MPALLTRALLNGAVDMPYTGLVRRLVSSHYDNIGKRGHEMREKRTPGSITSSVSSGAHATSSTTESGLSDTTKIVIIVVIVVLVIAGIVIGILVKKRRSRDMNDDINYRGKKTENKATYNMLYDQSAKDNFTANMAPAPSGRTDYDSTYRPARDNFSANATPAITRTDYDSPYSAANNFSANATPALAHETRYDGPYGAANSFAANPTPGYAERTDYDGAYAARDAAPPYVSRPSTPVMRHP
ncbi:MAG: hypothetical protein INR71_03615 [Terriglobus roseus]|nr:hypothetical protein [Terriglobus roseus]